MVKLFLAGFFFFLASLPLYAQRAVVEQDSVFVETSQDTILIKSYASRYSPRKAMLRCCRGWDRFTTRSTGSCRWCTVEFLRWGTRSIFTRDFTRATKDSCFIILKMV